MSKFRRIQSNFLTGEVSPTALGRTDLPQYQGACELFRNVIPLVTGGGYRRPGSVFSTSLDYSLNYAPRLIPFIVSESEAYTLMIYKTIGGTCKVDSIRVADNITGLTNRTTASGTLPYNEATAANLNGNYDEWQQVQYVQSVDTMYLVHPLHPVQTIRRVAQDQFTCDVWHATLTGTVLREATPFLQENTTAITLTFSATTGNITVTASAPLFTDAGFFGVYFKIFSGASYGFLVITGVISTTVANATVLITLNSASATLAWAQSAWSGTRGYPRTVSFFEQRLCFGGTASNPDSIWFSQSSNPDVMSSQTVQDPRSANGPTGAQPFTAELSSKTTDLIQWLSGEKVLQVGTASSEWIIDRGGGTIAFGGDNVKAALQTKYGSSYRQSVRMGNEAAFCLRSENELRTIVYNVLEQTYQADPVQYLFDHYPKSDVYGNLFYRPMNWDATRNTLWCCDTAGNFFSMTRDRKLGVTQWATHQMGGYDSTLTSATPQAGLLDPAYYNCAGSVISLAIVPNPIIGIDDVWLCVKRKVNGVFVYHIERMIGRDYQYDSAYVALSSVGTFLADACVFHSVLNPASFTFSGYDHLEGQILQGTAYTATGIFVINGSAVSGGNSTIQSPHPTGYILGTYMIMGLPYSTIIIPVRTEAGSAIGSAQGALKKIHLVFLRFRKTLSCKFGRDANNLENIIFKLGTENMAQSPEVFTGDKKIYPRTDYDRDGKVYILQDVPLPFTLISLTEEGMTYD